MCVCTCLTPWSGTPHVGVSVRGRGVGRCGSPWRPQQLVGLPASRRLGQQALVPVPVDAWHLVLLHALRVCQAAGPRRAVGRPDLQQRVILLAKGLSGPRGGLLGRRRRFQPVALTQLAKEEQVAVVLGPGGRRGGRARALALQQRCQVLRRQPRVVARQGVARRQQALQRGRDVRLRLPLVLHGRGREQGLLQGRGAAVAAHGAAAGARAALVALQARHLERGPLQVGIVGTYHAGADSAGAPPCPLTKQVRVELGLVICRGGAVEPTQAATAGEGGRKKKISTGQSIYRRG